MITSAGHPDNVCANGVVVTPEPDRAHRWDASGGGSAGRPRHDQPCRERREESRTGDGGGSASGWVGPHRCHQQPNKERKQANDPDAGQPKNQRPGEQRPRRRRGVQPPRRPLPGRGARSATRPPVPGLPSPGVNGTGAADRCLRCRRWRCRHGDLPPRISPAHQASELVSSACQKPADMNVNEESSSRKRAMSFASVPAVLTKLSS